MPEQFPKFKVGDRVELDTTVWKTKPPKHTKGTVVGFPHFVYVAFVPVPLYKKLANRRT
jgi:hypothetical protein